MGSAKLLMTPPPPYLPNPSTGRPVAFPLWEVLAPSSLMRWPPVPAPACEQLKVVHLAKADYSFLDQLQAVPDKAPFSTNTSLHNKCCIAPEVSNGSIMQSWFLAAKIDSFSGVQGSLLNNAEL
jgi:hypothetical protein